MKSLLLKFCHVIALCFLFGVSASWAGVAFSNPSITLDLSNWPDEQATATQYSYIADQNAYYEIGGTLVTTSEGAPLQQSPDLYGAYLHGTLYVTVSWDNVGNPATQSFTIQRYLKAHTLATVQDDHAALGEDTGYAYVHVHATDGDSYSDDDLMSHTAEIGPVNVAEGWTDDWYGNSGNWLLWVTRTRYVNLSQGPVTVAIPFDYLTAETNTSLSGPCTTASYSGAYTDQKSRLALSSN